MKSSITTQIKSFLAKGLRPALLAMTILALSTASSAWAGEGNEGNPRLLPPQSHPNGKSYGEWGAAWWQWYLGLPLINSAGVTHPATDDPRFNVKEGQSGHVWFLTAPFPGTFTRSCTIPVGKALFFETLTSEWSSLEGFPTEAEQRATAKFFADHIVNPFCLVDGQPVQNIGAYRVATPQFNFSAPSPWIFGDTGGTGTAVGEGFSFFLAPLSPGHHTIRYGGAFHFSIAEGDDFDLDLPHDMTYLLTVGKDRHQGHEEGDRGRD